MAKKNREMINDLQQAISMLEASEAFERALEIELVSKDEEDRKRFEVANDRVTDTALEIVAGVHEELLRQKNTDPYYKFDEMIIDTRENAEKVLDAILDLIIKHGKASVSDYHDLIGVTGTFKDEKYGWFDLRQAEVRRVREGYVINLPRPVDIDN